MGGDRVQEERKMRQGAPEVYQLLGSMMGDKGGHVTGPLWVRGQDAMSQEMTNEGSKEVYV